MAKNRDHQVIRHAYENTLNACARLSAYATAKPTQIENGLVDSRQTILAANDFMEFSINSRRLMENVESLNHFQTYLVKAVYNGTLEKRPITRLVNVIVHHNSMRIRRFQYEMDSMAIDRNDFIEYYNVIMSGRNAISPHVFVESDSKNKMLFEVINLTNCFEEFVLPDIINICADVGLHLDNYE